MKVYIGNISFSMTEADLRQALADFEPLADFFFATDRATGQPRGFAFATFASREIGEEAIRRLNGADIGGRTLKVNEAREAGAR